MEDCWSDSDKQKNSEKQCEYANVQFRSVQQELVSRN